MLGRGFDHNWRELRGSYWVDRPYGSVRNAVRKIKRADFDQPALFFGSASPYSAGVLYISGLMPGVIGVPLQNRKRPIDLLQQNHSRQFMRQRHLPK